jgi:hypothetical protein
LERHKIEPVEFKSQSRDGIITLDMPFRSQDQARLFERTSPCLGRVAINLLRGASRRA